MVLIMDVTYDVSKTGNLLKELVCARMLLNDILDDFDIEDNFCLREMEREYASKGCLQRLFEGGGNPMKIKDDTKRWKSFMCKNFSGYSYRSHADWVPEILSKYKSYKERENYRKCKQYLEWVQKRILVLEVVKNQRNGEQTVTLSGLEIRELDKIKVELNQWSLKNDN